MMIDQRQKYPDLTHSCGTILTWRARKSRVAESWACEIHSHMMSNSTSRPGCWQEMMLLAPAFKIV